MAARMLFQGSIWDHPNSVSSLGSGWWETGGKRNKKRQRQKKMQLLQSINKLVVWSSSYSLSVSKRFHSLPIGCGFVLILRLLCQGFLRHEHLKMYWAPNRSILTTSVSLYYTRDFLAVSLTCSVSFLTIAGHSRVCVGAMEWHGYHIVLLNNCSRNLQLVTVGIRRCLRLSFHYFASIAKVG